MPVPALACVIRRSVDVDDELSAGAALSIGGAYLVPDVFAHIHAYLDASDGVDGALAARLEVSLLVKDTVVGQEYLVVDVHKLAVAGQRRRVVYLPLFFIGKANHHRYAKAGFHHFVQVTKVVLNELRFE